MARDSRNSGIPKTDDCWMCLKWFVLLFKVCIQTVPGFYPNNWYIFRGWAYFLSFSLPLFPETFLCVIWLCLVYNLMSLFPPHSMSTPMKIRAWFLSLLLQNTMTFSSRSVTACWCRTQFDFTKFWCDFLQKLLSTTPWGMCDISKKRTFLYL